MFNVDCQILIFELARAHFRVGCKQWWTVLLLSLSYKSQMFKCLKTEKLQNTNPFILNNSLVFLHQYAIALTISLNFLGSMHSITKKNSLANVAKFLWKNVVNRSSKLASPMLYCLTLSWRRSLSYENQSIYLQTIALQIDRLVSIW